jgi:hypothetical protein
VIKPLQTNVCSTEKSTRQNAQGGAPTKTTLFKSAESQLISSPKIWIQKEEKNQVEVEVSIAHLYIFEKSLPNYLF